MSYDTPEDCLTPQEKEARAKGCAKQKTPPNGHGLELPEDQISPTEDEELARIEASFDRMDAKQKQEEAKRPAEEGVAQIASEIKDRNRGGVTPAEYEAAQKQFSIDQVFDRILPACEELGKLPAIDRPAKFKELAAELKVPEGNLRFAVSVYNRTLIRHPPSRSKDGDAPLHLAKPKAFVWRDPKTIPPRRWLYGGHYIRKFATATIAPGGMGKSSLQLVEAISMSSGKDLLNSSAPIKRLKVWYWNLEDPADEIERRIAAIALHYGLNAENINGHLFVNSGREDPVIIATSSKAGFTILEPVADNIIAKIKELEIDVLILDPFVSCHQVSENDNGAIDAIAKKWGAIADKTNCCIEIAHHTRKSQVGGAAEKTVDDARGASGLHDAVRSMRVLNAMTAEEAKPFDLVEHRRAYFRISNGKANMRPAPASTNQVWFKFVSVGLSNEMDEDEEDSIGVITTWKKPDALVGLGTADLITVQNAIDGKEYGANIQAKDWAGYAIGKALGIDTSEPIGKTRVKDLVSHWLKTEVLREGGGLTAQRKPRPIIVKGKEIILNAPVGESPF